MMTLFAIYSATVPGSEHLRLHRNNQDGLSFFRSRHGLVAVVTDGCSAGAHSEVGAKLGARVLATAIGRRLAPQLDPTDPAWITGWCQAALRWLESTSRLLACAPSDREAVIADYLLFSFLAAIVTPTRVAVIGVGDGAWGVDGCTTFLDAGPDNAPPYLAYSLVDTLRAQLGATLEPKVHFAAASASIESLHIASDGLRDLERHAARTLRHGEAAGGVRALIDDVRWRDNPSRLQKRLRAISEQAGPLRDDLSLALLTRRKEAPCA